MVWCVATLQHRNFKLTTTNLRLILLGFFIFISLLTFIRTMCILCNNKTNIDKTNIKGYE